MANFDTNLFRKKNRHRGLYGGKFQSVTGALRVTAGQSIALADLIRAVPMGENTRPLRVTLSAIVVSGTPVLTNPTFNVGVIPLATTAFVRPDGTSYPVMPTDADILSAAAVLDADRMFSDIEVPTPVADGISKYAPYTITLTPAGAGAFSVAGGDIDLQVTVEFLGEQNTNTLVYDEFVNDKVAN